MRGSAYSSVFSWGFTVPLQSRHIRTVPFGLATGTIGVAQWLNLTLYDIPLFPGVSALHLPSVSWRTERALFVKLGWTTLLQREFSCVPMWSWNTSPYLSRSSSSFRSMSCVGFTLAITKIGFQSSWICVANPFEAMQAPAFSPYTMLSIWRGCCIPHEHVVCPPVLSSPLSRFSKWHRLWPGVYQFGNISSYFWTGSVDTAEPVSCFIFRVWPLTFGVTQISSPPGC